MKLIHKAKQGYIVLSVAISILGVFLIAWPRMSLLILCDTLGIILILLGIFKLMGYFSNDLYRLAFQFDLGFGIFLIVFGIIILLHPKNIVAVLPTILGIVIMIDGVLRIQTAKESKSFGLSRWWLILMVGICTTLFGMLLILKPFESAAAMMTLVGIALLIYGVQNISIAICTVKSDYRIIRDSYHEM